MQIADWHKRYMEQAQWTKTLRRYLLAKIPLQADSSVLELGCGTGAILQDFNSLSTSVVGLDIDLDALTLQGNKHLVNADAYDPPFKNKAFDLIFCHYFLLWLSDAAAVINQSRRLLKPGGYLAVFAEPDYTSRQTSPEPLKKLADLQIESLAAQGANLKTGRLLGQLLSENGFSLLEFGTMKELSGYSKGFTETEKNVLRADWEFLQAIRDVEFTKEELESLLSLTPERWYVPTYFGLAVLNK